MGHFFKSTESSNETIEIWNKNVRDGIENFLFTDYKSVRVYWVAIKVINKFKREKMTENETLSKHQNGNDFIADVSTSTDIEVGNIVKYLPKDPASWIGVVTEIKNDEETKRHGYSGDVYIVQDPFSTVSIATRKENLLKGEFA